MQQVYNDYNEHVRSSGKGYGHFMVDMCRPGHLTICLRSFQNRIHCTDDNWDAQFGEHCLHDNARWACRRAQPGWQFDAQLPDTCKQTPTRKPRLVSTALPLPRQHVLHWHQISASIWGGRMCSLRSQWTDNNWDTHSGHFRCVQPTCWIACCPVKQPPAACLTAGPSMHASQTGYTCWCCIPENTQQPAGGLDKAPLGCD